MAPHAGGEILSEVHIAVESVRNSFALLHEHLHSFIVRHLSFRHGSSSLDSAVVFWQLLGVEPAMIDLVSELDLWWDGNSLLVNDSLQGDTELMAKVSTVVLYMFR
jgi:hypothetical protein